MISSLKFRSSTPGKFIVRSILFCARKLPDLVYKKTLIMNCYVVGLLSDEDVERAFTENKLLFKGV